MDVASRDLLPTRSQAKVMAEEERPSRQMPSQLLNSIPRSAHPPKVTGLRGNEVVSIKSGLSRPAHPPKVTGEQFINTFTCDALTSNGNELYDPPSNQGKIYTDTDSNGKTDHH